MHYAKKPNTDVFLAQDNFYKPTGSAHSLKRNPLLTADRKSVKSEAGLSKSGAERSCQQARDTRAYLNHVYSAVSRARRWRPGESG